MHYSLRLLTLFLGTAIFYCYKKQNPKGVYQMTMFKKSNIPMFSEIPAFPE